MTAMIVLVVGGIGIVMAAMAIGVMFKRAPLRGSCGGPQIFDTRGNALTCESCPKRRENPDCEYGTLAEGECENHAKA